MKKILTKGIFITFIIIVGVCLYYNLNSPWSVLNLPVFFLLGVLVSDALYYKKMYKEIVADLVEIVDEYEKKQGQN